MRLLFCQYQKFLYKASLSNSDSQREISLFNCIYKLYDHVICIHLEKVCVGIYTRPMVNDAMGQELNQVSEIMLCALNNI